MNQKDMDQLRAVLTHLVEDGDTWVVLPKRIQEHASARRRAAMAQFLRLESEALAGTE